LVYKTVGIQAIQRRIAHAAEREDSEVPSRPTGFISGRGSGFRGDLKVKADQGAVIQECRDWSNLSLDYAMREIEHEDSPVYTFSDLNVSFP
jgi:hypothetical protein